MRPEPTRQRIERQHDYRRRNRDPYRKRRLCPGCGRSRPVHALDLCGHCYALGPDPDQAPRNRTPDVMNFHQWAAQHWRQHERDIPDSTPRWQRLAEKRERWLQYVQVQNGRKQA